RRAGDGRACGAHARPAEQEGDRALGEFGLALQERDAQPHPARQLVDDRELDRRDVGRPAVSRAIRRPLERSALDHAPVARSALASGARPWGVPRPSAVALETASPTAMAPRIAPLAAGRSPVPRTRTAPSATANPTPQIAPPVTESTNSSTRTSWRVAIAREK